MKIEFEFNDKNKSGIEKQFFQKVFDKTLERVGVDFLNEKNLSLSLVNISEEEIKEINKKYRKKDLSTDVLSFSEYESTEELKKNRDKNIFLGEIVLCYNDIRKYSQKEKKDSRIELAKVVSHGLLHLLGFSHSEEMFKIQKSISSNLFDI